MATYLPSSSVPADGLQTLYLMKSSYGGSGGSSSAFGEGPNPATNNMMMFVNPSGSGGPILGHTPSNSFPPQQVYYGAGAGGTGGGAPPPSFLSGLLSNPSMGVNHEMGGAAYAAWGGPEMMVQPPPQQPPPPLHLHPPPAAYSSRSLGGLAPMESPLGPDARRGLSLSLSPQRNQLSRDGDKDGKYLNKWFAGDVISPSPPPIASSQASSAIPAYARQEMGSFLTGSKYLKAAQELLDEVACVSEAIKGGSSGKHRKSSLAGFGSSESFRNGGFGGGGGGGGEKPPGFSDPLNPDSAMPELAASERQDLQMKKAKLMAMLEEVDRRYRQYYFQMQMVVSSFESAAGAGSAKTYTSLALKTISRHFRCLRNAIGGQVWAACKSLGEADALEDMAGKAAVGGESSRMMMMQQYHLNPSRPFGMMMQQQPPLQQQPHVWRPQRGLPERSVSILRAWLFEHFLHPYPKDVDKVLLAKQTGLSRSQVSNWFINARVRLWKPMVEEMYTEEMKEAERSNAGSEEKMAGNNGMQANDDGERERGTIKEEEGGGAGEGGVANVGKANAPPNIVGNQLIYGMRNVGRDGDDDEYDDDDDNDNDDDEEEEEDRKHGAKRARSNGEDDDVGMRGMSMGMGMGMGMGMRMNMNMNMNMNINMGTGMGMGMDDPNMRLGNNLNHYRSYQEHDPTDQGQGHFPSNHNANSMTLTLGLQQNSNNNTNDMNIGLSLAGAPQQYPYHHLLQHVAPPPGNHQEDFFHVSHDAGSSPPLPRHVIPPSSFDALDFHGHRVVAAHRNFAA